MGKLHLNFYYKNLIIVFLVTCLPMAIIAVSNYYIGVRQIETEVKRSHQLQLQQVYESMEKQITHLKAIGNQWVFNPVFNNDLQDGDLRLKPNTTREILASLRILKETSPLIDNAVLYLQQDGLVVSDEEGINAIADEETKRTYEGLLAGSPALLWWEHPIASPLKYKSSVDVALVHKVQGINGDPFGTLILYLEKSQIDDVLSPLNPDGEGVAFILRQDGDWVTNGRSPGGAPFGQDEAIRSEVLKRGMQGGDFIFDWSGKSYSVTVGAFSRNDWKYVVATPISKLTSPVILFSKLGLLFSLVGLLIGGLLSWLASRSIYRPVKRLVGEFSDSAGVGTPQPAPAGRNDEFQFIAGKWRTLMQESRQLATSLESNRQSLKEGFLLQLLQGHLHFFSRSELAEKMAYYGWSTERQGFAIILVRIDGIGGDSGKFNAGDEQLATFAAANITQEVAAGKWPGAEVINFHDLSLAVLLPYSSDRPREQVKSDLFHLSGELIDVLTRYTTMRITVGVGKLVADARHIHQSLEEAREALSFRDLDKNEQILDMDNMLPQDAVQVTYPFKLEHAIIQSMKMGLKQEAALGLASFAGELRQSQGKVLLFQQGMLQLLGSIMHALLKSGAHSALLQRGGNPYEKLSAIKDPDEMIRWMRTAIIEPYIDELAHTRDMMLEKIVNRVIETIYERYRTPLSLESCADEHGVTSYNLSKAFKQYTGTNFIDFLTNTRLEQAKKLLVTTEMKMNDIAEQVGYQPTYFIRIFKKVEGITPGRYREMNQS